MCQNTTNITKRLESKGCVHSFRKQILELLQSLKISSDSVLKMVDELASLLDMFRSFKKAGRSAALTMSTKGGTATKVKLEVELDDAEPSPISTSTHSTSPASAPSERVGNFRFGHCRCFCDTQKWENGPFVLYWVS